jgi:hypothetical protein
VTGGGKCVANHAGARLVADVADSVGLTAALSTAMAPTKQRATGHDRGQVLTDLAVALADGATTITDLAVLRDQPKLFGHVASGPTVWRTLAAIDDATLERIAMARAVARAQVWARGGDPGFYVIDIDATLIGAHSEKEKAAPTYKKGFGFHPLMAYLDATGEALAALLRPGNAGSGTATDHIEVLDAALEQLPVDPTNVEITLRSDTAGCSHALLDACAERNVRFVVGHALTLDIARIIAATPPKAWVPAVTADGSEERDHAEVTELTDRVSLDTWPPGTRMIVRREICHPGAQLTYTDHDGHRFCVCITDLDDPDIAYLEALYRGRGRVERRICDAKDTGLANLPSASFAINQAWVTIVSIAQDLLTWTQQLALSGSDLATAEPKRLRYCLLHTAALVATTSRQRFLRFADDWPWTPDLITGFDRVHSTAPT